MTYRGRVKLSGSGVTPEWEGRNLRTNHSPRFIGSSQAVRQWVSFWTGRFGFIVFERWSERVR